MYNCTFIFICAKIYGTKNDETNIFTMRKWKDACMKGVMKVKEVARIVIFSSQFYLPFLTGTRSEDIEYVKQKFQTHF